MNIRNTILVMFTTLFVASCDSVDSWKNEVPSQVTIFEMSDFSAVQSTYPEYNRIDVYRQKPLVIAFDEKDKTELYDIQHYCDQSTPSAVEFTYQLQVDPASELALSFAADQVEEDPFQEVTLYYKYSQPRRELGYVNIYISTTAQFTDQYAYQASFKEALRLN